jgi:sodium-dependent dicarboxylate transporter 2/3/5
MSTPASREPAWVRLPRDRIGLILGPFALIGWVGLVPTGPLTPEAHRLFGILILTLIWWITEPIPIPATGLLAVALTIILQSTPANETGRDSVRLVLAPFADPSVFFLMGGLFLGRSMSRHGLDRRLALTLLNTRWAGRSPGSVLLAVGIGVTFVSMWISNTAATAMMCPIAVGLVAVLSVGRPEFARSPYATALVLMTAFGSSVGGIATPIGTATNVVAIGFITKPEVLGRSVDFLAWCAVGIPMMVLIFGGLYGWLRFIAPARDLDLAGLRGHLREEYERLGPWKIGERNTLAVFVIVVALWVTPGILEALGHSAAREAFARRFPEEITALLAPVLLYILPTDFRRRQFTLGVGDFQQIDWGTLLQFGAALSLGGLMFRTGLAEAAGRIAFAELGSNDLWVLTAVAIIAGTFLSEFTSNTATASALLPVVHRLAIEAGVDPLPPLLGLTFAASAGSALPVSTPPNAIVYGTGLVPIRRMIRAGLGLDLVFGVVVWLVLRVAWGMLHWTPLTG